MKASLFSAPFSSRPLPNTHWRWQSSETGTFRSGSRSSQPLLDRLLGQRHQDPWTLRRALWSRLQREMPTPQSSLRGSRLWPLLHSGWSHWGSPRDRQRTLQRRFLLERRRLLGDEVYRQVLGQLYLRRRRSWRSRLLHLRRQTAELRAEVLQRRPWLGLRDGAEMTVDLDHSPRRWQSPVSFSDRLEVIRVTKPLEWEVKPRWKRKKEKQIVISQGWKRAQRLRRKTMLGQLPGWTRLGERHGRGVTSGRLRWLPPASHMSFIGSSRRLRYAAIRPFRLLRRRTLRWRRVNLRLRQKKQTAARRRGLRSRQKLSPGALASGAVAPALSPREKLLAVLNASTQPWQSGPAAKSASTGRRPARRRRLPRPSRRKKHPKEAVMVHKSWPWRRRKYNRRLHWPRWCFSRRTRQRLRRCETPRRQRSNLRMRRHDRWLEVYQEVFVHIMTSHFKQQLDNPTLVRQLWADWTHWWSRGETFSQKGFRLFYRGWEQRLGLDLRKFLAFYHRGLYSLTRRQRTLLEARAALRSALATFHRCWRRRAAAPVGELLQAHAQLRRRETQLRQLARKSRFSALPRLSFSGIPMKFPRIRKRLRSFSFHPTLRQAGALWQALPRWRSLQIHGDTLLRLHHRGRKSGAHFAQRPWLQHYASWWMRHWPNPWVKDRSKYSDYLRDGVTDAPQPAFWNHWVAADAFGLNADALGYLDRPALDDFDSRRQRRTEGHSSPLGRLRERPLHFRNQLARPILRRQLVPKPLAMGLLSQAKPLRQKKRDNLRNSWNQILVRKSRGEYLVTRLGRAGLYHFFGGTGSRGFSLQKYVGRTARQRASRLRRSQWNDIFSRFYRRDTLMNRRRRVTNIAVSFLGGFLFRTSRGFSLSWKSQRRWERVFFTTAQVAWRRLMTRRVVTGRSRSRSEGRILHAIYKEWENTTWDSESSWFKYRVKREKDQAMHRRAQRVNHRWRFFMWKRLRSAIFRRRLGRLFRRQRRTLKQQVIRLESELATLAALRSALAGALSPSRRRTLARRLGRRARRLRSRSQRLLPMIFQRLPALGRGNTSLLDNLWSSLGQKFRLPSDRRWIALAGRRRGQLLASLGQARLSRIRSGFFGHLNDMLDQPLATGRLRHFLHRWSATGFGGKAFPAASGGGAVASSLGGGSGALPGSTGLDARREKRFDRSMDRDAALLRPTPYLHSSGELSLRCKGERVLNSFLSQVLTLRTENYLHLSVAVDKRQRREHSVEQKKYFREIRRDARLELPRAKRLHQRRSRRGRRSYRLRRSGQIALLTHWALPLPNAVLRRAIWRRSYPRRRTLGRVNVRHIARICLKHPQHRYLRPFGVNHRSSYRLRRRRRRENFGWRTISQLTLGMKFWMERTKERQRKKQRRRALRRKGFVRSRRQTRFRYGSKKSAVAGNNLRRSWELDKLLRRHSLFGQWTRLMRRRQRDLARQRQLRVKTPIWFKNIKTRSSRDVRVNFARGLISYSKRTTAILGVCKGLPGRRRRLRRRRQLRRPLLRWLAWRQAQHA